MKQNIDEANRALRRLNMLHETIGHWSMEVIQAKRRGGELCKQLSSGLQINGSVVTAPPVAKSTIADATARLLEAFGHLEENVLELRKDLIESISLHDLLQDVNDLEVF